ncbi:MAG: hypothetical protein ABJF01_10045 [bacterium]
MSNATLSFLPWTRQGAAASVNAPDPLNANLSGAAQLTANVAVNGGAVPAMTVRLRGPADVLGIDTNQVVRTDPRPGNADFEPNCFPSIEFDRPDFPWLFTPASPTTNGRLRPWLCLIVVRKQDGVTYSSATDGPLPALRIGTPAQAALELPDLSESWAWAHAQAAAPDSSAAQVDGALNGPPALALSRLICPRVLAADVDYIACVVPTFELGRAAGLGLPLPDSAITASNALSPAWTTPPAAGDVLLPVYYHWEFRAGDAGDFESLARKLTSVVPEGLGKRQIDITNPGFPAGFPAGTTVTADLEGALLPIVAGALPPADPAPLSFQNALAPIVNAPSTTAASNPSADPLLAPPLYGRWHAARSAVTPGATSWLDELNLDARWRAAAAFGTRVIQKHQEALMASAWDQAGDLASVNQRVRQLQLSLAVGERLHAKHFAALSDEMMLRVAAPAFGRLWQSTGKTLLADQETTLLPIAANRSAMRRIARQRGPLTRRIAAQGFTRSATSTWIVELNQAVFPAPPAPPPIPSFCALPVLPTLTANSNFGVFTVWPENVTVPAEGTAVPKPYTTDIPGYFRSAADAHLKAVFTTRIILRRAPPSTFDSVTQVVLAQTQPRVALAALARSAIITGDNVLPPTAPGVTAVGLEGVMAAPQFTQAMYEPLRDLSQDLLLPGLEHVAPDTVLGMKTNRRFVDSYLVGLNHEMARELLWRGYPTDQRGTYFAHFWGSGNPNTAPADIVPIPGWFAGRPIGDSLGPSSLIDQFVMLLRSSLLRRYPNAIVYLTPALKSVVRNAQSLTPDEDPAHEHMPVFSGSLQPDVTFIGFNVTTAAATGQDGGAGHYLVIQEHPTEPRFGVDAEVSLNGATHLSVTAPPAAGIPIEAGLVWAFNAAHMAGITRRRPVRLAIHASRLLVTA